MVLYEMKKIKNFLFLLILLVILLLVINNKIENTRKENILIKIVDLSSKLDPNDTYFKIKCRKSLKIIVSTTLCIHNLTNDIYVSQNIWNDGIWERNILESIVNYLNDNPDWLVLDVGAQIGQYSLFAAAMGRKVLTVEPFHDNILRIHKAAYLEKTFKNIILIKNAISNKRNEIKLLATNEKNIGGQSLIDNKDKTFEKDENNKYLVETILFDDIVPYLPFKDDSTKEKFKKAILKIDIEGFEPFAFEHASLLFDTIDIRIIFMEWGNLPKQTNEHNKIKAMIEFLYSRNYQAFVDNKILNKKSWMKWPWDIIWKKQDFN